VLIAADQAFSKTFGLIVTFVGIGLIVNVILIYVAVQVRGQRRQNEELLSSRRPPED
jgi:heme/copper-type cytochrome/quinol oxidase subunit 2